MEKLLVGIDVGSTTIKIVCMNENKEILYSTYERHFSNVIETSKNIFEDFFAYIENMNRANISFKINVTGSAGMGVSEWIKINFVQEVIACIKAIEEIIPETDVAIELGGEDAKITFLKNDTDQRMNGSCAGGTGAFVDQIASLLNTDASGLNELAKNSEHIYPIASRCGVFAKTDIQPLINEGARKEDIAVSVLQAVVNQTITGLACGKKIQGKVAFLGGPLFFLSELRKRFIETLKLSEENIVFPKNSQLFVAEGAAFLAEENEEEFTLEEFKNKIKNLKVSEAKNVNILPVLFDSIEEEKEFFERHDKEIVEVDDINSYEGDAYLGIDAGSTTIKIILMSEENKILYSYYSSNKGSPIEVLIKVIKELYEKMDGRITIRSSCVTGYGENLIKKAFNIDEGIVETIAHYRGARYFSPDVDFILDIGGQDMKCLKIKDGVITSILLNEACSSGCGSFLETFSNSLGIDIKEFAKLGMKAKHPADLGTRCTVFMNSKVKQAQKDGADVGDISAGLSYSIIKNTLFKVIKMKNKDELGNKIVVQGGTFLNNSVLRAFEKISEREVIRPNIAGLMGAFGCAILAKEKAEDKNMIKSSMLNINEINKFSYTTNLTRCGGCGNNCLLTIHKFQSGERFISGNRCDNFIGKLKEETSYNMVDYKYNRVFNYKPLEMPQATRGEIGIPRVLNMYDDYPFWFTFFNNLGYRVILSDDSSKELYVKGMDTISSDSICYPAKLVHGHIVNLVEKGIKTIFYPCVVFSTKEEKKSENNFNCPVVISYSEVIKNNMDILKERNVEVLNPFISLESKEVLYKTLEEEFKKYNITSKEIKRAVNLAWEERINYKKDIRNKAKEILDYLEKENKIGIVLCGRPYHIDKEINHGIPNILSSYKIPILTGDAVASLETRGEDLRVVDQWTYHSRVYKAAEFVGKSKRLELIEFNSFSCGIDAIVTDQVAEILEKYGKIHTVLKIDEINNMGAIKIRIRSLLAAIEDKKKAVVKTVQEKISFVKKTFTKKDRKEHTILAPQMSPIHFKFIEAAFKSEGYNLVVLNESKKAAEIGLKYVNNDACYPAILVIGELIEALQSGKYNLEKTSVLISQTGGSCRATNYIGLLRKALKDSGFGSVPVLSLNASGYEKQEGFKITLPLLHKILIGVSYGDLLMKLLYQTRPYEVIKGTSDKLYEELNKKLIPNAIKGNIFKFKKDIEEVIQEFSNIKIKLEERVKVGVVGEILVKFSPCANNHLVRYLESEGCEVRTSSLISFINYCLYGDMFLKERFKNKFVSLKYKVAMSIIDFYTGIVNRALEKSDRFKKEINIKSVANKTSKYISIGNQSGEGWFLMGEMLDFIEDEVENIVCVQPFGCLPNHITGKGMIKRLKEEYEYANITSIDYDPAYSEVNQINRIKLMVSIGKKNLAKQNRIVY